MSNLANKLDDYFTYADYLSWDDDERYEIIDGVAYMMASPTERHQAMVLPGLTVDLDAVRANVTS